MIPTPSDPIHATSTQASPGFAGARLAAALVTAAAHPDPATRDRAAAKARDWQAVLHGMASGTLAIGSRTPVHGLPAWVTTRVLHGGFASGKAAAGGPLEDFELAIAARVGIEPTRRALFAYHLTEDGLGELRAMLATGAYHIDVPEAAVLPTIAWLADSGDVLGAWNLIDTVDPFSDDLRFMPVPLAPGDTPADTPDAEEVHRYTVQQTRERLLAKRRHLRIEAMREALTVWNPLADDLLRHWVTSAEDATTWHAASVALLDRYDRLAQLHRLCGKHKRRGSNIETMIRALREATSGDRTLTPRTRGLLRCAVEGMLARRGEPDSPELTALRERQNNQAARPATHEVARLLADRLATMPQLDGIRFPETVLHPVTPDEAATRTLPAGTDIPASLHRIVEEALIAPLPELVRRGIVPSAEALAGLVPQITAAVTSARYRDPALRRLAAGLHRAFSARRSVLLLNLAHQVRYDELPWARAIQPHLRPDTGGIPTPLAAFERVAEATLRHFPGTITPNPLVSQLAALAKNANQQMPLVEELAADIFEGRFTAKFAAAARLAAGMLADTVYDDYYDIGYRRFRRLLTLDRPALPDVLQPAVRVGQHAEAVAFTTLCGRRAGLTTTRYRAGVAHNGAVIEQAMILTTHNLALLAAHTTLDWAPVADGAYTTMLDLLRAAHHQPRPLAAVKNAAYAWRQTLFALSRLDPATHDRFLDTARDRLRDTPWYVRDRAALVLNGLDDVLHGTGFDADGIGTTGRRFLGWTTQHRHWLLDPAIGPAGDGPR